MADSGDALFQKAESLVKGGKSSFGLFSFFGLADDEARYEEAVKKFNEAATAYEEAGNVKRAGETLRRTAAIYRAHIDGGEMDAATKEYTAFNLLKEVDPEEAIKAMDASIKYYKSSSNAQRAGKRLKELAEFYEDDLQDQRNAMIAYEEAVKQFKKDNLKHAEVDCKVKYAEYLILLDADHENAAEEFEAIAKIYKSIGLGFKVPGILLKAGLCRLAKGVRYDMVGVREMIKNNYPDPSTWNLFQDSREVNFLNELVQTAEDGDPQEFGDACYRWEQKSKLDPVQRAILLAIKTEIENAGEDFS